MPISPQYSTALPLTAGSVDKTVFRQWMASVEAALAALELHSASNLLINGDFAINQRAFSGGALGVGAFGHDRWFSDSADCYYNVGDGVVGLTAGVLAQVIVPSTMGRSSLAGLTLTLSAESLTGSVPFTVGAQSGALPAGAGRQSATITLGAGETGSVKVRLAPPGGGGYFSRVKLEVGASATPWAPRTLAEELALCQRFFAKSFPAATAPQNAYALPVHAGFAWSATGMDVQRISLPTRMRATPTIALYGPAGVGDGTRWGYHYPSGSWVQASGQAVTAATDAAFTVRLTGAGFTFGDAVIAAGSWTASAEVTS